MDRRVTLIVKQGGKWALSKTEGEGGQTSPEKQASSKKYVSRTFHPQPQVAASNRTWGTYESTG